MYRNFPKINTAKRLSAADASSDDEAAGIRSRFKSSTDVDILIDAYATG
jgi:hypothetical protein